KARDDAEQYFSTTDPTKNVLVYHLDTGYYKTDDGVRPMFLDLDLSRSFVEGDRKGSAELPPGYDRFESGFLSNAGHGTSTLSILAGNRVDLPAFHEFLGGAPYAHIASCRISQSVVHLWTGSMVAAMKAAIDNHADVIAMAAGSPPSGALLDAVNRAYDNGVAMVFASSDYFQSPICLQFPPHTTVYPARFSRTLSATGVTSEYRSYSRAWHYWYWLLKIKDIMSWMMRGSYGPDSVMDHTMASYTPNVAAQLGIADGTPNLLKVDFAGTSAATPQLAAAAALWLQVYRNDPVLNEPWKHAEGVYEALQLSALKKPSPADPDSRLGFGALDASAALAMKPAQLPLAYRKPSTIGFNWLTVIRWIIGNDPPDVQEAKRAAHERMLRVEAAQLFQSSPRLRKILLNGVDTEPDAATRAAFVSAVTHDPRASAYLREHLGLVAQ
ncbi:MAG TPA: S8/S53 family peptidase, partial [Thermoanaerobaculia bacterium]|nr:S8/S53 family peptidase [Thermoanaerobaculia bacterium]